VFLDRDGTVVEERDYLSDPAQVQLLPGAAAAIRRLRDAGFAVVIVTNQSGIARGLYGEDAYRAVQGRLKELLERGGAAVDASYHCPHHPDFSGPCACRKPGPALYGMAATDLGISLERSWFVGDKVSDVQGAARFGGRAILVRTGYGRQEEARLPPGVPAVANLAAAAALILSETSVDPFSSVE
jgi:D-glycero-D-manno-heptose 1,7-bisphosphate phosphatase